MPTASASDIGGLVMLRNTEGAVFMFEPAPGEARAEVEGFLGALRAEAPREAAASSTQSAARGDSSALGNASGEGGQQETRDSLLAPGVI